MGLLERALRLGLCVLKVLVDRFGCFGFLDRSAEDGSFFGVDDCGGVVSI